MNCQDAERLFDSYLNGELYGSLSTEFAAHRLHCADCRRALALMEVVEHVITAPEEEPSALSDGFTSRLMACLDGQAPAHRVSARSLSWWRAHRTSLMAAAAALAFIVYGGQRYFANPRDVLGIIEQGVPKPAATELDAAGAEALGTETLNADQWAAYLKRINPHEQIQQLDIQDRAVDTFLKVLRVRAMESENASATDDGSIIEPIQTSPGQASPNQTSPGQPDSTEGPQAPR